MIRSILTMSAIVIAFFSISCHRVTKDTPTIVESANYRFNPLPRQDAWSTWLVGDWELTG
ncbi:MAG TPA: hypothetical protein PK052_05400 [Anaerohalosphaeraceae bacterium]|nr:hypothetical protein [Phycisphaerae bacterium]HOK96001.1 hypothetical protein [Anaerohalosphaeraceae bacterium]HOL31400.1 hypothetical protein [Anaerohalosphaeraceae bacterium]HOM74964.1 hypothetical protein [Anaerohalosphaeraceae bacterium]HPC63216.1 hypothetical protein [Anaerohalosphaeraceae bacterium]